MSKVKISYVSVGKKMIRKNYRKNDLNYIFRFC